MFEKKCPVCGTKIIGRTDKIYCSNECRVHANNSRRRSVGTNREKSRAEMIGKELLLLQESGGVQYLKIIGLVTRFCKILYKFGR